MRYLATLADLARAVRAGRWCRSLWDDANIPAMKARQTTAWADRAKRGRPRSRPSPRPGALKARKRFGRGNRKRRRDTDSTDFTDGGEEEGTWVRNLATFNALARAVRAGTECAAAMKAVTRRSTGFHRTPQNFVECGDSVVLHAFRRFGRAVRAEPWSRPFRDGPIFPALKARQTIAWADRAQRGRPRTRPHPRPGALKAQKKFG